MCDYNRLASSVARELIEIGVRCVVAAGWAVDDDAAYTFAETFYQNILQDNLQFGDAVFAARRETYRKHGGSITWGAYQAYGDPGWRINPGGAASSFATGARKFVAPEELLDGIAAVRMKISRHRDALSKPYARNLAAELQQAHRTLAEKLGGKTGSEICLGGSLRRARRRLLRARL